MVNNLITRRRGLMKDGSSVIPPSGDWYGVDWYYGNSSPQLTRIGAAANFADPQPATSLNGTGSSPFDNIMPWAGMKRYNFYNDEIIYSEDDAEYSESTYETMVYIPEFYYRAEKNTTEQRWTWAISPTAQEGFEKHPGSGRYISRFHASDVPYYPAGSMAGLLPIVNKTPNDFRTACKRETSLSRYKWYMLDIATWSAVQMLYLIEFANFNSQNTLGTGYSGKSAAGIMGETGNAVYHTLKISEGHNQYRWIEDPFSNVRDWIDGFLGNTSNVYVGTDNHVFDGQASSLSVTGLKLPASSAIQGFGYSEMFPWLFIPDVSSGTDYTTYVCDRVQSSDTLYPVNTGGNYTASGIYGFFFFYASSSAASSAIGTRLICYE